MTENTIGIAFEETMAGGFALGEKDPKAGRERGEAEGIVLAMHAKVEIPDIDQFIDNPDHLGKLSGTVDFPPFTNSMVAPSGVFNLFSPSNDPSCKLMVYELAFEHNTKSYYLAGKKEVRDAMVTKMWTATTTLYTQLHEGDSKDDPIIGAGVLTLGMRQLIELVTTMRTTNSVSPMDTTEALTKFGRFFMGDLWGSYVKHAKC